MFMLVFAVIIDMMERTIEAQIVQNLKNNEPRPKCTGFYKKKEACTIWYYFILISSVILKDDHFVDASSFCLLTVKRFVLLLL